MMLPSFPPRSNGLPSSLDRLARFPKSVPSRSPNTNNTGPSAHSRTSTTSNKIPFQITPGALATDNTNHSLGNYSSMPTEKICIDLSPSEHKKRQWCSQVESLKLQSNKSVEKKTTTAKPFGNFRKRRPTRKDSETSTKNEEPSPQKHRPEPVAVAKHEPEEQSPPGTIIARKVQLNLLELKPPSGESRRVRFQLSEEIPDATSVTLDTTISTDSSGKSKRSTTFKSSKGLLDISNHGCLRSKSIKKSNSRELYWSRLELNELRHDAEQNVQQFQVKYPGTVRQVDKLFEEFCSSRNTKDEEDFDEIDEENEEMMRAFLEDWAAFGLRGLEEEVTGRRMFLDNRSMAVGSILTYQERLRTRERNQLSMYLSPEDHAAALYHRAELLRARSESTSHRARMFAMYMALGDALFVANEDDQSFAF